MSNGEIDYNQIISNVIENQINNIFGIIQKHIQQSITELTVSFKKYLSQSYSRVSKTKTLLYKDAPVNIEEIYVDPKLFFKGKTVYLNDIIDNLSPGDNYLISATAGAGKSILAKMLFLKLLENKNLGIPIFFELRNINNTDNGIIESILEIFNSYDISLTKEYFDKLLIKGKFILILDGYDEIEFKSKNKIDNELKSILSRYENTPIFITTRPDESLESIPNFYVINVEPLDKEQAVTLIKKLNYDHKVKEKFIKKLKKNLFDKHSDFLSNPLLLTIMLLTYSQIAEIPEKMHIFYEQAFDALFFKHDALKSMYKRDIRTKLPIDDFKQVLSIIAIKSYMKNQVNFSNTSLLEYIRNAKKLTGLNFKNDHYKYDLLKSVCILVNDGTFFTFTHRSFQEYFSAYFISNFELSKKKELLKKLLKNHRRDNVLQLAYEINPSNIEKNLIIPVGKELLELYSNAEDVASKLKIYFKIIVVQMFRSNSYPRYFIEEETIYWYYTRFFLDIYRQKYKKTFPKFGHTLTKKAFLAVFGKKNKVNERIVIEAKNQNKLINLGIFEFQEKQIKFIQEILPKIIIRNSDLDDDIEEFI